ncbi:MAG: hypothetical protein ABIH92_03610 [Nanoarchaeota archaeon]
MAKVIITKTLEKEINKVFKKESIKIFELMKSLESSPKKGKPLAQIGNILVKEIRYKSHRFYFITDKYKIKALDVEELKNLLIKFVSMSDKKDQQYIIEKIKTILRTLGEEGFA